MGKITANALPLLHDIRRGSLLVGRTGYVRNFRRNPLRDGLRRVIRRVIIAKKILRLVAQHVRFTIAAGIKIRNDIRRQLPRADGEDLRLRNAQITRDHLRRIIQRDRPRRVQGDARETIFPETGRQNPVATRPAELEIFVVNLLPQGLHAVQGSDDGGGALGFVRELPRDFEFHW